MADRNVATTERRDVDTGQAPVLRYTDLGISEGGIQAFAEANAPATGTAASATLTDGALATSTTAAPLEAIGAGHAACEVYVQNADAAITILVGTATDGQPTALPPGKGVWLPCLFTSQIYARAASGTPTLNWLARSAVGAAVVAQDTTATVLATNTCEEVVITADVANTANTLVGNGTSQHIVLTPGRTIRIKAANSNLIKVKAASGTVNFFFQCRVKL